MPANSNASQKTASDINSLNFQFCVAHHTLVKGLFLAALKFQSVNPPLSTQLESSGQHR